MRYRSINFRLFTCPSLSESYSTLVLLCYQAAEAMTPNGTRRRSARLSLKGCSLTEANDEEMHSKGPPFKRARKCLGNGTENKDDDECLAPF